MVTSMNLKLTRHSHEDGYQNAWGKEIKFLTAYNAENNSRITNSSSRA